MSQDPPLGLPGAPPSPRPPDLYERFCRLSDPEWEKLWIEYAAAPDSRADLPAFPSEEIQRRIHGTVFERAMRGALALRYHAFRSLRRVVGKPIVPEMKVLDFGCGWGRVLRVLLKDFHTSGLHGTDLDPEVIELARKLLPEVRFSVNDRLPPLGYRDRSFDLVLVNSVFSHLAERNFWFWIEELTRVLEPGGVLVFTSWGQGLLDIAKEVFGSQTLEYAWQQNILDGFQSYEQLQRSYLAGEFIFAGASGGALLPASDFGIAMVPRRYFERNAKGLILKDFLDDPQQFTQTIFVAQKEA